MSKNHHTSHDSKQAHPAPAAAAAPVSLSGKRLVAVLGLMALAFFGAYNFASARTQAPGADLAQAGGLYGQPASGGGGGCCGGGGAPVEGAATVEGDVQKIAVDTSTGSFNPNVIRVKAGVPLEIAFSQSPGGCLSGVLFPDFGISEDLTAGPKTVKLPALEKGTYTFYCQMQMVSAQIIAE